MPLISMHWAGACHLIENSENKIAKKALSFLVYPILFLFNYHSNMLLFNFCGSGFCPFKRPKRLSHPELIFHSWKALDWISLFPPGYTKGSDSWSLPALPSQLLLFSFWSPQKLFRSESSLHVRALCKHLLRNECMRQDSGWEEERGHKRQSNSLEAEARAQSSSCISTLTSRRCVREDLLPPSFFPHLTLLAH